MNNSLGEDIFMGKSTEITDLVMHPNQFENILTNNLNTINNNLINNGTHDEDNFMQVDNTQNFQQPLTDGNPFTLNDDNNNSNNNFNNSDLGPETNVDPDDDISQNEDLGEAAGGEKEKIQTEPKETDDQSEPVFTGFDDFTGDVVPETNPANQSETNTGTQSEESAGEQNGEAVKKGTDGTDSYGRKVDEFRKNFRDDCTECENEFDLEISNEINTQSTFDAVSHSYKNDEDLTCEEQFEKLKQQFMQPPLENISEIVNLESEEIDHDESMKSPFENESICANEVNEEVAIQQEDQEPLMTGKPKFYILILLHKIIRKTRIPFVLGLY